MDRTLENAIVRLLRERPFYGQLLLTCRRERGNGDQSLGVTIRAGVPVLAVNGARFPLLAPAEQEALLEHAVKHLLHLHMSRRKERNRHDWDIACDLAINPTIAHLPGDAVLPAAFRQPDGLAAEEYYARLSSPFDTGNLEGKGIGTAEMDSGGHAGPGEGDIPRLAGTTVDDHTLWDDADSTPLRLAEEVVRGMVREARRACDGEVPVELGPLVAALLAPAPIPWRRVLRQFVATAGRVGRIGSWSREHRRFEHLTPGTRKRRLLHLLVGVDVSDSTDAPELREEFARELLRIARGATSRITVLYANSRIQRIESLRGPGVTAEVYRGGGFTDLRPVFAHARTLHPRPAAVIYLTDGFGEAPESMEFPTLWVLTKGGKPPAAWGVELRLDV